MKRFIKYWPDRNRLVYFHANATPEYWDSVWQEQGAPTPIEKNHDVLRLTKKYLPIGARVLEAGCGRGDKVDAMAQAGFNAIGIDFAPNTVRVARQYFPTRDIRIGDVRNLEFEDASFDGLWSLGVIEHFWNGYESILAESNRVLRPGGYLFLTTPWFSPYRRRKALAGGFPLLNEMSKEAPEDFYQFALAKDEIKAALARHGFVLKSWAGRAPEISMLENMDRGKSFFQWLLTSRGGLPKRIIRKLIVRAAQDFCGHSFMSVSRRAMTR